jgi:hypothetical protein
VRSVPRDTIGLDESYKHIRDKTDDAENGQKKYSGIILRFKGKKVKLSL